MRISQWNFILSGRFSKNLNEVVPPNEWQFVTETRFTSVQSWDENLFSFKNPVIQVYVLNNGPVCDELA